MSSLLNSPASVFWEDVINRSKDLALQAVATNDFSTINARVTQSIVNETGDQGGVLAAVTGTADVTIQIQDINVATVQIAKAAMDTYSDAVFAKKNDSSVSADDWKALLDTQQQNAITAVQGQIANAAVNAISLITTLPEAARAAAANLSVTGSHFALQAINTLGTYMADMWNYVKDFLGYSFTAIGEAVDTVDNAVTTAIDAILGWSSSLAQRPEIPSAVLRSPMFVGKLNWPATTSVTSVIIALTYVTKYLVDHDIRVTQQTTIKESDAKETTSRTVIEKTSREPASSTEGDDGDLKTIRKQAVDQLGNDGHYIPSE